MLNQQLTIILVHGAGTGPWIWRRLQDALPLPSVAVEVPSRREDATPASCADQVVKQIAKTGAERVVLVLHSLAGVLASELAARLGDRIESTVFVAAVVPAPGEAIRRCHGFPKQPRAQGLVQVQSARPQAFREHAARRASQRPF